MERDIFLSAATPTNFFYKYTRELRKDGALVKTKTWEETIPGIFVTMLSPIAQYRHRTSGVLHTTPSFITDSIFSRTLMSWSGSRETPTRSGKLAGLDRSDFLRVPQQIGGAGGSRPRIACMGVTFHT